MAEPRIVVANREDLWWLLAEASQLEHMIMCQYLFAEFSLKQGTEEGLSGEQAGAVERWRKVLRGIAVEEMLHMALVANTMAAIGAAPTLGRPNFPQRSGYFPSSVLLDLVPFGERALKHFLYLERPEGMERQDAEGFIPSAPPRQALSEDELMPRGQEFLTVGHLYRGVKDGLRELSARSGERALFLGSPRAQATPELLRWPQLIAVTGLDSALAAIEEIIEQGEGARGNWRTAHYGRFLAMWQEFHTLREQDPGFEPALPVLAAYTRQPFDIQAEMPIISDPLTRRVAELATVSYELVLHLLTRFFTHTDESDEQLGMLIGTAIELMADVIRPLATTLARMPVGPEHPDHGAGFAFQMHYAMGTAVPSREAAWALLHERMAFLAGRCADAAAHDQAPAVVADAGQRVSAATARLAAHVPSQMRARVS
jgi:Ferritin-like